MRKEKAVPQVATLQQGLCGREVFVATRSPILNLLTNVHKRARQFP